MPNLSHKHKTLTLKQRMFCEHYVRTLDAKESARLAGYSFLAQQTLYRLRKSPLVQAQIKKIFDALDKQAIVSKAKVVQTLTDLSMGTLEDVCSWDSEGKITIKSPSEMSDRGKAIIKSIKVYDQGKSCTIVLHDKVKSIELLAKHLRMLDDHIDVEHTGSVETQYTVNFVPVSADSKDSNLAIGEPGNEILAIKQVNDVPAIHEHGEHGDALAAYQDYLATRDTGE